MGKQRKQNMGPYSNDGYQPTSYTSHLDFIDGDEVIYIGHRKNHLKRHVPNDTTGTVLEKDNTNKLHKSSRSFIRVDFGNHGIRQVHKNNLQFPRDRSECIERLLDGKPVFGGINNVSVNDLRYNTDKINADKINKITTSRENRKDFRNFRRDLLDKKELELEYEIASSMNNPKYNTARGEINKLSSAIDEIKDNYTTTGEPLTKLKFMNDNLENNTPEQLEFMFKTQKEKDMRRIKMLKHHMMNATDTLKGMSSEMRALENAHNSSSRSFFSSECATAYDYNRMLHSAWGKLPITDTEPSMTYSPIDPDYIYKDPPNIDLLKWGLYPRDVAR